MLKQTRMARGFLFGWICLNILAILLIVTIRMVEIPVGPIIQIALDLLNDMFPFVVAGGAVNVVGSILLFNNRATGYWLFWILWLGGTLLAVYPQLTGLGANDLPGVVFFSLMYAAVLLAFYWLMDIGKYRKQEDSASEQISSN